jgi:hypothetical protein
MQSKEEDTKNISKLKLKERTKAKNHRNTVNGQYSNYPTSYKKHSDAYSRSNFLATNPKGSPSKIWKPKPMINDHIDASLNVVECVETLPRPSTKPLVLVINSPESVSLHKSDLRR